MIAVASFFYLIIMSAIFLKIYKSSKFWPVFLSIEYFYFFGLGIYPILLSLDLVNIPLRYAKYNTSDTLSVMTFFHIILYAVGAGTGFFFSPRLTVAGSNRLVILSRKLKINPFKLFYLMAFIAIAAAVAYLYFVGVERAIVGASSSRGGDFSDLAGVEGYSFLKRFTILGLYAVAFFPFIVASDTKVKSSFLILFSIGILGYITTVSRFALFESILVPLLIYFSYKFKPNTKGMLFLLFVFSFAYSVLFYGKEFVQVFSNYYFLNKDFELPDSSEKVAFFDGFSHLLFSIDAGILNFLRNGPFIATDIWLSLVGFLPSGVFTFFKIPELSYQLVTDEFKTLCVNTKIIDGSGDECYIPPYFTGMSAYVMPLAGGFFFGYIRFYIYSVIHRCWVVLKGNEYHLITPYFFLLLSCQFMLFIPATISLAVFFCIMLFLYFFGAKVFQSSSRG